uniref:Uncharacterized protein n=1 Tax=Panagrolaimus superbus TaxID=310955 RepID=A0A914Y862_9BILA
MIREKDRYRILEVITTNCTIFSQEWKNDFIGGLKPNRIILLMENWLTNYRVYADQLKNYFKKFSFDVIETRINEEQLFKNAIVNTVLHLMGEKISVFKVAESSFCRYSINIGDISLIKFNTVVALPFENSIVADIDSDKSVTLIMSSDTVKAGEVVEETKLSKFKSPKVRVSLKIDINSFYDLKIVPIDKDGNVITKFNIADSCLNSPIETARLTFGEQEYTVSVFKDGMEYMINDFDG